MIAVAGAFLARALDRRGRIGSDDFLINTPVKERLRECERPVGRDWRNQTRVSFNTSDLVLNGYYFDTYLVDGLYAKDDYTAIFHNTNLMPVSYSITFSEGVPEPATWAMMLFGIGAIGAGMRRARRSESFSWRECF